MNKIVFEEPPRSRKGSRHTRYADVAKTLKQHPGAWARIRIAPTRASADSTAFHVRSGTLKAFGPQGSGTFEAVARTVENEFRVYARYVGAGEENPE